MPGLTGADGLAPAIRLVHLADSIEAFHHAGGAEAAVHVARERRGTQFDPALVDCGADCVVFDFATGELVPDRSYFGHVTPGSGKDVEALTEAEFEARLAACRAVRVVLRRHHP